MDLNALLLTALIGLVAGVMGGLAGIGGSMVMIPALGLVFGFATPGKDEQHAYMAAAMAVNVVVAMRSAWSHRRAGVVRPWLVKPIVPAMVAGIVAGVLISNLFKGQVLKYVLAAFVALYCLMNIARAIRPRPERVFGEDQRPRTTMLVGIGSTAGTMGGVLGVGGGVVLVPMLQLLGKVPLRLAIGASSASMILSALVGAVLKFGTLGQHGQSATLAGLYALAMAPTAVLGADLGARLTHALPLRLVRVILSVLLLAAAWRLAEMGTILRGLAGP